jgi:hypothetical protein
VVLRIQRQRGLAADLVGGAERGPDDHLRRRECVVARVETHLVRHHDRAGQPRLTGRRIEDTEDRQRRAVEKDLSPRRGVGHPEVARGRRVEQRHRLASRAVSVVEETPGDQPQADGVDGRRLHGNQAHAFRR